MEREEKTTQNRKIDSKNTFQVLISKDWWQPLSLLRAMRKKTFKELVEYALGKTFAIDKDGNPYEIKK